VEIKEDTTDADPIDIGVKLGGTARLFDIFVYKPSKTSDQCQFPVERKNEAVTATLRKKKVSLLKDRFSSMAKKEVLNKSFE
jgi:hypothetical protein